MLHVEGQRALSPIQPEEVRREPLHRSVVATSEVAAARTLDLDYLRAQVGQMAGTEGSRDRLLQRQHAYPGERAGRIDAGVILLGAGHAAASPPVRLPGSDLAS
jgi:hypothetical protein